MALMNCHFHSTVLNQSVDVNVIVPTPNSDEQMTCDSAQYYLPGERFKTIFLLHGAYGNYNDWCRYSRIEKYAEENRVAVVMPSVANSFCLDMLHGENYKRFVGEELVTFVRYMFPLSDRRADTCIAGLSMGGYCAYYLAFQYPEVFGAAASLSGALDIEEVRTNPELATKGPFRWESLYQLGSPEVNLIHLYCRLEPLRPKLYQTCGTEDFLYNVNNDMYDQFQQVGAAIQYETGPGMHDWDFWDKHIPKIVQWTAKSFP